MKMETLVRVQIMMWNIVKSYPKSDHPRPFTQDLTIIKSHFVKVQAWSTIHVENVMDDTICVLSVLQSMNL